MRQTIFERYGGFTKVSKVVMSFYDKVLDSPITSPYSNVVEGFGNSTLYFLERELPNMR